MKKTIFTLNVSSVIDLITNSSSELFILEGETREIVEDMLENTYADYRSEYEELKRVDELTTEELNTYISYVSYPGMWPASKSMYTVLPGFTFDEMYEPKKDYKTGLPEKPAWNGEIQYELRDNTTRDENANWHYGQFVTDDNREDIVNRISPDNTLYFLFSIDENPNWEMQESLECIATRYHLG